MRGGHAAAFIETTKVKDDGWPTARGRSLACSLSSHLFGRRAGGVGKWCYRCVEMNREINVRSPGGRNKAKMFWKMCGAKGRCENDYHRTNEQKLSNRKCGPAGAVGEAFAESYLSAVHLGG